MGQSPSAYLYYGVRLPSTEDWLEEGDPGYEVQKWLEEYRGEEDREFSLDPFFAEAAGLVNPYDETDDDWSEDQYRAFNAANPDFRARVDAYYEAKRQAEKDAPLALGTYGSYEFGGYILYIPGATAGAYGWTEKPVDMDAILASVTPESIAEARLFCHTYGLPSFENPQWWLCPSYG